MVYVKHYKRGLAPKTAYIRLSQCSLNPWYKCLSFKFQAHQCLNNFYTIFCIAKTPLIPTCGTWSDVHV